ncbi:MAG: hypothetical protein C0614_00115 [Desulfuromonas sp.]|nr:MAG: hypothetical protein C0614_00115 [Desulfuromonas sp.]
MAAVFNVDKKSIVMMKQRGTSADDLWVVNWVAIKGAVDPETLLEARAKSHSWQNIQTPLSPLQEKYGPRFTQALAANFPTDQLAVAIVDDLLTSYRLLDGGNWIHCEKKVPQTKS